MPFTYTPLDAAETTPRAAGQAAKPKFDYVPIDKENASGPKTQTNAAAPAAASDHKGHFDYTPIVDPAPADPTAHAAPAAIAPDQDPKSPYSGYPTTDYGARNRAAQPPHQPLSVVPPPVTTALQRAANIINVGTAAGPVAGALARDVANPEIWRSAGEAAAGMPISAQGPKSATVDVLHQLVDVAIHGNPEQKADALQRINDQYGTVQEKNLRSMGKAGNWVADFFSLNPPLAGLAAGALSLAGPGNAVPGLLARAGGALAGKAAEGASVIGKGVSTESQQAGKMASEWAKRTKERAANTARAKAQITEFARRQAWQDPQHIPGPPPKGPRPALFQPNAFRYQNTPGKLEVSPVRGGTYFTYPAGGSGEKLNEELYKQPVKSEVGYSEGGPHRVDLEYRPGTELHDNPLTSEKAKPILRQLGASAMARQRKIDEQTLAKIGNDPAQAALAANIKRRLARHEDPILSEKDLTIAGRNRLNRLLLYDKDNPKQVRMAAAIMRRLGVSPEIAMTEAARTELTLPDLVHGRIGKELGFDALRAGHEGFALNPKVLRTAEDAAREIEAYDAQLKDSRAQGPVHGPFHVEPAKTKTPVADAVLAAGGAAKSIAKAAAPAFEKAGQAGATLRAVVQGPASRMYPGVHPEDHSKANAFAARIAHHNPHEAAYFAKEDLKKVFGGSPNIESELNATRIYEALGNAEYAQKFPQPIREKAQELLNNYSPSARAGTLDPNTGKPVLADPNFFRHSTRFLELEKERALGKARSESVKRLQEARAGEKQAKASGDSQASQLWEKKAEQAQKEVKEIEGKFAEEWPQIFSAAQAIEAASHMPKGTPWETQAARKMLEVRRSIEARLEAADPALLKSKLIAYTPMNRAYSSPSREAVTPAEKHIPHQRPIPGVNTESYEKERNYFTLREAELSHERFKKGAKYELAESPYSGLSPQRSLREDLRTKHLNVLNQNTLQDLRDIRGLDGQPLLRSAGPFKGPDGAIILSKDGKTVGAGAEKNAIKVWTDHFVHKQLADKAAQRAGLTGPPNITRVPPTKGLALAISRAKGAAKLGEEVKHRALTSKEAVSQELRKVQESGPDPNITDLAKGASTAAHEIQSPIDRLQKAVDANKERIPELPREIKRATEEKGVSRAFYEDERARVEAEQKQIDEDLAALASGPEENAVVALAQDMMRPALERYDNITSILKPRSARSIRDKESDRPTRIVQQATLKPHWTYRGGAWKKAGEFDDIPDRWLDLSEKPNPKDPDRTDRMGNLDDVATQIADIDPEIADAEALKEWLAMDPRRPTLKGYLADARDQLIKDARAAQRSIPTQANREKLVALRRAYNGLARKATQFRQELTGRKFASKEISPVMKKAIAESDSVQKRLDTIVERALAMAPRSAARVEALKTVGSAVGNMSADVGRMAKKLDKQAKTDEAVLIARKAAGKRLSDYRRELETLIKETTFADEEGNNFGELTPPGFTEVPHTMGMRGADGDRLAHVVGQYFQLEGAPAQEAEALGAIMGLVTNAYASTLVWNPFIHGVNNMGMNYIARTGDLLGWAKAMPYIMGSMGKAPGVTSATGKVAASLGMTSQEFNNFIARTLGKYDEIARGKAGAYSFRENFANSDLVSGAGKYLKDRRPGYDTIGPEERSTRSREGLGKTEAERTINQIRSGLEKAQEWNSDVVFNRMQRWYAASMMKHLMVKEGLDEFKAADEVRLALETDRVSAVERSLMRTPVLGTLLVFYPWMKTIIPFSIRMGFMRPQYAFSAEGNASRTEREYAGEGGARQGESTPDLGLLGTVEGKNAKGNPNVYRGMYGMAGVLEPLAEAALGSPNASRNRYSQLGQYGEGHLTPPYRAALDTMALARGDKGVAPWEQTFDVNEPPTSSKGPIGGYISEVTGGYGFPAEKVKEIAQHGAPGFAATMLGGSTPSVIEGSDIRGWRNETGPAKQLGDELYSRYGPERKMKKAKADEAAAIARGDTVDAQYYRYLAAKAQKEIDKLKARYR